MTTEEILRMKPGREIDLLVHKVLFGGTGLGSAPRYSTTQTWLKILEAYPLIVGRFASDEDLFTADKPYFARDRRLRPVRSATPAIAACKALLISKLEYEPGAFD